MPIAVAGSSIYGQLESVMLQIAIVQTDLQSWSTPSTSDHPKQGICQSRTRLQIIVHSQLINVDIFITHSIRLKGYHAKKLALRSAGAADSTLSKCPKYSESYTLILCTCITIFAESEALCILFAAFLPLIAEGDAAYAGSCAPSRISI